MKALLIALILAGIFPASGAGQEQAGVGRASSLDMLLPAASQLPEESSEDARPTRLTYVASKTGITCGGSYDIVGHKGENHVAAAPENQTPCDHLYAVGYQAEDAGQYAESYDTLEYYMVHCDTVFTAPRGFGDMYTDVQEGGLGPEPKCWIEFKNWLISVLPLRHDPLWFCTDVQTLAGTPLVTRPDTGWANLDSSTNDGLAVIRWLLQNPLCATREDSEAFDASRGTQWNDWVASVDTNKVKLDTALPSLHDLGLDSVLKYAALLGVHESNMASIISNASAYPNPTGEGTLISFGIGKEAYVIIRLFDVLGHDVTVSGFGGVVQPGNLSVPLSLQGLPAGTYYARIQTTYGDVQTVKLVKQ